MTERKLPPRTVFLARCAPVSYRPDAISETAPELPGGRALGAAEVLVRKLLAEAGLDLSHAGTSAWNPLSDLIRPGEKVVIKPNWVYHKNGSGHGMDCLVTHTSVVAAVLKYLLIAAPSRVVVGDAPVQGCDFEALRAAAGLNTLLDRFPSDRRIAIKDFRCTKRTGHSFAASSVRSERTQDDYIEFDLGASSWLEPVTGEQPEFRVTMYDPAALRKTHGRGVHRYLVAREIIEADVVFNLPKLKTHKKAGITGALKNVVGINGLKDYLPHHRKGSPERGGDCYPRASLLKTIAEACLDIGNQAHQKRWLAAVMGQTARVSGRLEQLRGGDRNLEGGWYGNDTVWRTVMDLQRILTFGKSDGTVASSPQRRVIHITDAIVAGDGDGPLYPRPVPLGVMTMSADAAAAEWVHALIMGFDPNRITLTANALRANGRGVDGSDISVLWDGRHLTCEQVSGRDWPAFQAPTGWAGHCELQEAELC